MNKRTFFNSSSHLVTCLIIAAMISGCVSDNKNNIDKAYDRWKVKAEESRGYSPSVKRSMSNLEKEATVTSTGDVITAIPVVEEKEKTLPGDPVSLNMSDVDVAVLLRSLARAAGQNIMINEKVGGRANINIHKAPWNQVFLGILKTHGLSYKWEGDILRIMTAADMQQDLQSAAAKIDLRELEPLATRIIRIDYTEAAALKTTLEAFLTRSKNGKTIGSIMVDSHTNTLIVQALEEEEYDYENVSRYPRT